MGRTVMGVLFSCGLQVLAGSGVKAAQVPADPWQVADRLVASLGGREVWAATRTLYVRETAYPSTVNGPVTAEFWRDLDVPAYRSRVVGSGVDRETRWSRAGGWTVRNGVRTEMSPAELAAEIADWKTEPYVLYHRLARHDAGLRLALRDDRRLDVYERSSDELLGWFVVDAQGGLLVWGNFYEGQVSEHVYGPARALGAFRMPRWGAATDGSWRFEYDEVRGSPEPLEVESNVAASAGRAQEPSDEHAVRQVLENYVVGWREADVPKLTDVFAPNGHVIWRSGTPGAERFNSMAFAEVLTRRRPQPDYGKGWRVESLDILDGQLAVAKLHIPIAKGYYLDYLTLHKIAGRWRIVNKTYVMR